MEQVGWIFSRMGVGRWFQCTACGAEQAVIYQRLQAPKRGRTNPYLRRLYPQLPGVFERPSEFRGSVTPVYREDMAAGYRVECRACHTLVWPKRAVTPNPS